MTTTAAVQPVRLNYFNDEDYFHSEPTHGAVHDAVGRRLVRASVDWLAGLSIALAGVGANVDTVMYKLGRRWGDADFRAFAERAPREFGVAGLEQMHFQVMLESWRWPLTAAGWGTWQYDFRRARVGLPVVNLSNSVLCAVAELNGDRKPACHLYAGLFGAVFTALAKRELSALELQCAATGADGCRILVASASRISTATMLRDEGMLAEDILERLSAPQDAAVEAKEGQSP
jgi:uncharacterized protein